MRARYVILQILALAACVSDDPAPSTPAPDASTPDGSTPNDSDSGGGSDAGADLDATTDAGPSAYATVVLSDSPVAYWRFEETSGTIAKNSAATGSPYDLTLSAGFAAGDLGKAGLIANDLANKAVFFSGSTSASVPFGASTSALKASSAFTVEAWVRLATAPDAGTYTVFATKDPTGTDGYIFFINAGGSFGLACPTIGFYGPDTLLVPFDDKPHHLAVAWEGVGSTATFYLDGTTEQKTGPANRSILYAAPTATVGAQALAGGTNFLGVLDELALYDKALPVARLDAHRAAAQ